MDIESTGNLPKPINFQNLTKKQTPLILQHKKKENKNDKMHIEFDFDKLASNVYRTENFRKEIEYKNKLKILVSNVGHDYSYGQFKGKIQYLIGNMLNNVKYEDQSDVLYNNFFNETTNVPGFLASNKKEDFEKTILETQTINFLSSRYKSKEEAIAKVCQKMLSQQVNRQSNDDYEHIIGTKLMLMYMILYGGYDGLVLQEFPDSNIYDFLGREFTKRVCSSNNSCMFKTAYGITKKTQGQRSINNARRQFINTITKQTAFMKRVTKLETVIGATMMEFVPDNLFDELNEAQLIKICQQDPEFDSQIFNDLSNIVDDDNDYVEYAAKLIKAYFNPTYFYCTPQINDNASDSKYTKVLRIYNVHNSSAFANEITKFRYYLDFFKAYVRHISYMESDVYRQLVRRDAFNEKGHIISCGTIIMGDFNVGANNPEIQEINNVLNLLLVKGYNSNRTMPNQNSTQHDVDKVIHLTKKNCIKTGKSKDLFRGILRDKICENFTKFTCSNMCVYYSNNLTDRKQENGSSIIDPFYVKLNLKGISNEPIKKGGNINDKDYITAPTTDIVDESYERKQENSINDLAKQLESQTFFKTERSAIVAPYTNHRLIEVTIGDNYSRQVAYEYVKKLSFSEQNSRNISHKDISARRYNKFTDDQLHSAFFAYHEKYHQY